MTDIERREATIRLAERVMGWKPKPFSTHFPDARTWRAENGFARLIVWNDDCHIEQVEGWRPFEDISDAWMLVEAMGRKGMDLYLEWCGHQVPGQPGGGSYARFGENEDAGVIASTAPEAICLAALQMIEEAPHD